MKREFEDEGEEGEILGFYVHVILCKKDFPLSGNGNAVLLPLFIRFASKMGQILKRLFCTNESALYIKAKEAEFLPCNNGMLFVGRKGEMQSGSHGKCSKRFNHV